VHRHRRRGGHSHGCTQVSAGDATGDPADDGRADGHPVPTPTPAPSGSTTPTEVAACRSSDLTISAYGGDGYAGGGTTGYALRNGTGQTCQLAGFVDLTLVDRAGAALPTSVVQTQPATQVIVAPGAAAYFEVSTGNVPVDNEGAPCEPPAAALVVSLPDGGGSLTIAGPIRACGNGRLQLRALHSEPDPNMHQ
jgi:hypothetical protein